jgi:hypothetical protein
MTLKSAYASREEEENQDLNQTNPFQNRIRVEKRLISW